MNTLRLAVDSPQGRAALWSGTVEHAGTLHRVLPKRVEDTAHGRELEVELAPLQASDRPPTFALWLAAIRAISLTATLTPAAAVWLYGRVMGWPLHPLIGGLAVLGAVLLQVGVNLLNDVEDHLRLIDLPGSLGGSGVIQRGWLSAQQVRRGAWVAFAAGVLCGLPAVVTEPMVLAGVAALGLLGAIGYSARPLSLKYVALGDLAVLLLCGPVLTLGAAASAFGRIDGGVLWLGLWFGAAAVVILHVNNMQDIEVDRSRKALTVARVLGLPGARVYLATVVLALIASGAVLLHAVAAPWFAWAPWGLAAAVQLAFLMRVWRGGSLAAPEFQMVRVEAAQRHLMSGLLMMAALGLTLFTR